MVTYQVTKRLHARVLSCLANIGKDHKEHGAPAFSLRSTLASVYGLSPKKTDRSIDGILSYLVRLNYVTRVAKFDGSLRWKITPEGQKELARITQSDDQKPDHLKLLKML